MKFFKGKCPSCGSRISLRCHTPTPKTTGLATAALEKIRFAEQELGLSQREIARRIGCSNATISRLVAGVGNPSVKILEEINAWVPR